MRWIGLILLAVLAACSSSDGSGPDSGDSKSGSGNWPELDATLDGFLTRPGTTVSGYTFLLFDRERLIYSRAGGKQTLDSVLPIASASKMPAAAAILTLVDAGKLDLDVPVAQYIHAAGDPILWPPDKAAITMRMLLNHSSGLPGAGASQPNCLDRVLALSLQQCAQIIALTPLVSLPGAAFNYGGADFQIAGYVATLIAGQSWQDFFAETIGAPLGLSRFTYGDPQAVSNPRIAGGAFSDAGDYRKILTMILNDGRDDAGQPVLSHAAIALMKTDQVDGLPILFAPFLQQARQNFDGYSFGFWISAPAQHPGSAGPELSDPGLLGTTPWLDDDLGYGAVLLLDDRTREGLEIWDAVRPLIIQRLR